MEFLSVIAAAAAGYVFGAIWYMTLSQAWVAASGVTTDGEGQPINRSNPLPYLVALLCTVVVAGMMRHIFGLSGIVGIGESALAGLGVGLFLACPWLVTCYGFSGRPIRLMVIDGGYAAIGCIIIGHAQHGRKMALFIAALLDQRCCLGSGSFGDVKVLFNTLRGDDLVFAGHSPPSF